MTTLSPHANNGNSSPLPLTSGIYKITCTVTGKFYIGSALNLRRRRHSHFSELRKNQHHSIYLQRAYNKHGADAFIFEVLELVLPMSLTAREQYWLDKLKPFGRKGYNIAREAGSSLGIKQSPEHIEKHRQALLGRKHPPEELEKMRRFKRTPEHNEKVRQSHLGSKRSPESRERMRQAQQGHAGHKLTSENKEKLRQANLGRVKSPEEIEKMRITRSVKRSISKS